MGCLFPLKIAPSHGGFGPPSNTWFLGLTQVHNPNGISISSVVFAGLRILTDRHTNRPRYSVCNNRPHLVRCGLIITSNLMRRPHCCCTWTVQSYLPGCANVHAPSSMCFHGSHPSPYTKRHLDQSSHYCTAHGTESLYFTMDRHFPPPNCPFS